MKQLLGGMSIFTLLMTVPQIYAIWASRQATGVSLLSWTAYWISAFTWQTPAAGLARDAARIPVGRRIDLTDLCLFHGWIAGDGATGALVVPCRGCRRRFLESQFSLEAVAAADIARPGSCRRRNLRIPAAGHCPTWKVSHA